MDYTNEEKERLLWLNWNRISQLTHKNILTDDERSEQIMRCDMHNYYSSCDEGSQDEETAFNWIKKSLKPSVIKSVEAYMGKRTKGKGKRCSMF